MNTQQHASVRSVFFQTVYLLQTKYAATPAVSSFGIAVETTAAAHLPVLSTDDEASQPYFQLLRLVSPLLPAAIFCLQLPLSQTLFNFTLLLEHSF